MAKRIGVLGGISYESTLLYYRLIHEKYHRLRGDYHYPEVIVYSLDFQKFTEYEDGSRGDYVEYILEGVHGLEAAGAEFIVMAANSPHSVLKEVTANASVPVLSIAEATAAKAAEMGLKRLLLMGIKHTMQSSFYPEAFHIQGLTVDTPSPPEQDAINEIIFKELVIGVHREESKRRLVEIMERHPVDGVILGCTELPLIVGGGDTRLPLLDTADIHVDAALAHALGED